MSALPKEEEFQPTSAKLGSVWGAPVVSSEPIPVPPVSNDVRDPGLSLRKLIHQYKTDPVSPYKDIRDKTRQHYISLMNIIERKYGDLKLSEIRVRTVREMYDFWTDGKTAKFTSGHAKISMLRTMMGYGVTLLEDEECVRLSVVLRTEKFKVPKERQTVLTSEQVTAVRREARRTGKKSIARANAFQVNCGYRQGDVIGSWVPLKEMVFHSNIILDGKKSVGGLLWEEIDEAGFITHVTSKKLKEIAHPLCHAPMVIEELNLDYPGSFTQHDGEWRCNRALLPATGPIIVSEYTGLPWKASEFRRKWRILARAVGIPDKIWNMDYRATCATNATNAGVPLEHVAKMLGHSQTTQTQKYSRDASTKVENAMRISAAAQQSSTVKAGERSIDV